MQVSIYYAGPKGVLHEKEAIPVKDLAEAKQVIREMYPVEVECAEWNVRDSWIGSAGTEAHVHGLCRDEHVVLTIEEDNDCSYLRERQDE